MRAAVMYGRMVPRMFALKTSLTPQEHGSALPANAGWAGAAGLAGAALLPILV